MVYLLFFILIVSYFFILFKLYPRYHVNTIHAIIINYAVCVIIGVVYSFSEIDVSNNIQSDWFPISIIHGLLFITLFYITAYSAQKIGVSITSVASKMSFIIPALVSLLIIIGDYNEHSVFYYLKYLLAIASVFLSSYTKNGSGQTKKHFLIPLVVFIGTGIIDTIVNVVNDFYLDTTADEKTYPIYAFLFATLFGVIFLMYQSTKKKLVISKASIVGGIALGLPNYFSILFLIKALSEFDNNGAFLFPIANIGTIVISTLFSVIFFREKLSKINLIGVLLGIVALIFFLL